HGEEAAAGPEVPSGRLPALDHRRDRVPVNPALGPLNNDDQARGQAIASPTSAAAAASPATSNITTRNVSRNDRSTAAPTAARSAGDSDGIESSFIPAIFGSSR